MTFQGHCDIVGHVTIRLGTGHFLLVILWNQASISNGFRDKIQHNANLTQMIDMT